MINQKRTCDQTISLKIVNFEFLRNSIPRVSNTPFVLQLHKFSNSLLRSKNVVLIFVKSCAFRAIEWNLFIKQPIRFIKSTVVNANGNGRRKRKRTKKRKNRKTEQDRKVQRQALSGWPQKFISSKGAVELLARFTYSLCDEID